MGRKKNEQFVAARGILWGCRVLSVAGEGTGWVLHTKYATMCEPLTSSQGSQRLEGTRCVSPIPGEDPVGLGRLQFLLFARISRKHFRLHQTPQPGARLFLISDFIAK